MFNASTPKKPSLVSIGAAGAFSLGAVAKGALFLASASAAPATMGIAALSVLAGAAGLYNAKKAYDVRGDLAQMSKLGDGGISEEVALLHVENQATELATTLGKWGGRALMVLSAIAACSAIISPAVGAGVLGTHLLQSALGLVAGHSIVSVSQTAEDARTYAQTVMVRAGNHARTAVPATQWVRDPYAGITQSISHQRDYTHGYAQARRGFADRIDQEKEESRSSGAPAR